MEAEVGIEPAYTALQAVNGVGMSLILKAFPAGCGVNHSSSHAAPTAERILGKKCQNVKFVQRLANLVQDALTYSPSVLN